jgi:hypothetical protein
MSPQATDNSVPRELLALLSKERLIVRETQRAVTPFGGMVVFLEFLQRIDLVAQIRQHMPIRWRSHNQIDPAASLTAFLIAVLVGARRFVHANWLRGDRALHALLGLTRFPTDDTIRNLFRRFGMGEVHQLYGPLTEWQMERLPQRIEGYSLDLDSTVFERYGEQEGSLKGYNPRKHGRPSHHPLLAVLAEAHFLLHGWLRSGNCGPARGVVEFLKEALALWEQRQTIRVVRADSGFFDDELLSFLEQRRLPYIVVARMTKWVQRAAQRVEHWQPLDENYAIGEFGLQLWGWKTERRFIAVRECVRESRHSVGRKLIDVPGLCYRGGIPGRAAGLQPAGRVPTRRRLAGLSRTRHAPYASPDLRSHPWSCGPTFGASPVAKLGWFDSTKRLIRQHLALADTNFAEVESDRRDLIHSSGFTPCQFDH